MLMQVVAKMEDKNNPELAFNLQEKYQYILVDEFQDTNGVQLRLLLNLLNSNIPDYQPNILVVGDDDQAIYKFQGANIQNLWKFKQTFPESKEINLNLNYRSNQEILDVAAQVIEQVEQRFSREIGMDKSLISAIA
jgi:DNA helicase-2/ATP-dependent DNA helicase PcrA